MKKPKFTWLFIGLFSGIILTFLSFILFCPLAHHQCPDKTGLSGLPKVDKIEHLKAIEAIRCYRKNPIQLSSINGFVVSLQQLNAMNKLYSENPRLKGFRLYFGVVGDPVDVTIVSGTSETPGDDYVTDRVDNGPCPYLCDDKVEEDVLHK